MASLLFFLLFVNDFHQGPELPVPPLSAMASGPRGSGRRTRGRASAAAAALSRWPPASTPLRPRLFATGLRGGTRGSGVHCSGLRGSPSRSPPRAQMGCTWSNLETGTRRPSAQSWRGQAFFWKVCQPKSPQSGQADCCYWPLLAPLTSAGSSGGDRSGSQCCRL